MDPEDAGWLKQHISEEQYKGLKLSADIKSLQTTQVYGRKGWRCVVIIQGIGYAGGLRLFGEATVQREVRDAEQPAQQGQESFLSGPGVIVRIHTTADGERHNVAQNGSLREECGEPA